MTGKSLEKLGMIGLLTFSVGGLILVGTAISGFNEPSDSPTSQKRKWAYRAGGTVLLAGTAMLLYYKIETDPALPEGSINK